MIFTQLMGGLGNQMFQYAAGRALSLRLGLPLQIDLSWFHSSHTCTPREYALGVFPIAASFARDEEVAELRKQENSRLNRRLRKIFGNRGWWRRCFVREPHFHYWPGFENLKGPAMLEGYWQSENYFAASAGTIREDFAFPPLPAGAAAALAEEMREKNQLINDCVARCAIGNWIEIGHGEAGRCGRKATAANRSEAGNSWTMMMQFKCYRNSTMRPGCSRICHPNDATVNPKKC